MAGRIAASPLRLNDFDAADARRRCLAFRRRILDISQNVTALHIAPAFSCLETVDLIYHALLRRDAKGDFRDTFLMSKGHGCMAQYVILESLGVLSCDDLARYCKADGRLGAHPDYGVPGIAAATGSLGHGLGMAVGMAHADRILGTENRVYTVLSDGEVQEGSTWEAVLMAANLSVGNLIAFVDNNDFQSLGRTSDTHPHFYPLVEKFRAFGWATSEVNGHDAHAVFRQVIDHDGARPLMVICKTVKGRGVSYMEGVPIWHYRSPNRDEYERAIAELGEIAS